MRRRMLLALAFPPQMVCPCASALHRAPFESAVTVFRVGNKPTSKRSLMRLAGGTQKGDDAMTRLLGFMVLALFMGTAPILAAETSSPNPPPTAGTVLPEASKSATIPQSGSPDTSGGAAEQSSSPPSAESTIGNPKMGKMGGPSSTAPSPPSTSSKMGETPNPTAPGSND
jgi:hypothetical protein